MKEEIYEGVKYFVYYGNVRFLRVCSIVWVFFFEKFECFVDVFEKQGCGFNC